jgi:hypothetical protein
MKKSLLILLGYLLLASPCFARGVHEFNPPAPEWQRVNFLRIPGIIEMNLDFALAWTDSAAGLFLAPYDAVILHVDVDGQPHDVYIFSDMGMQRLCIWMCTALDSAQNRYPETITAYYGEDCGFLRAPSGITTNARNRLFDPENDLIYLADRGNDRILELAYDPDIEGGRIRFNRSIGEGYVEWPVDVALATYGGSNPATTDIFVVDWGHEPEQGELVRFDLYGSFKGSWRGIPDSPKPVVPFAKPVSIECFPDTAPGYEDIYISETHGSRILHELASFDTEPYAWLLQDLKIPANYWESGGVICDDYGRAYICNTAAGIIESWETGFNYQYPDYDGSDGRQDPLEYPTGIVLDTYYGVCEALVLERFWRETGIKTFIIDGGASMSKMPLGFVGGNLVQPAKLSVTQLPFEYNLNTAYPNPFNSECRILYDIPERTHVLIEVFNVLGQKVSTLVNEIKEPGRYGVNFDASKLSSGTYFYSLKTDRYSKTKSVVLIK